MKRLLSILAPSTLALVALAQVGCGGSHPPPAELQNARAAYNQAVLDPTANYNPSGVIESRQALDAAEAEYAKSPKSDEVKTLGYVAQRKAEIAEANAKTAASAQQEIAQGQHQLTQQKAVTGTQERRANLALEQLGLAVKDEPQGTVITLPNTGMFDTNKSDIKPEAKQRLADIAKAVKTVQSQGAPQDMGRTLMIIGYTDSTGSEERNAKLSKDRSEAVKTFFGQHGLDQNKIETEGRGEANPVGDNGTAQGRSENRRVEIIISSPSGSNTDMGTGGVK
jgi:outer membrane protein OmpA-like peptidoglycan-associated protein